MKIVDRGVEQVIGQFEPDDHGAIVTPAALQPLADGIRHAAVALELGPGPNSRGLRGEVAGAEGNGGGRGPSTNRERNRPGPYKPPVSVVSLAPFQMVSAWFRPGFGRFRHGFGGFGFGLRAMVSAWFRRGGTKP
jgi:hypothetical protein